MRHHGLIGWSLERLPRQAEVEFAELRLFAGAPGPGIVFVAPVLPGEQWEEGTSGSVGAADGVTWDTCPKADTRFTKLQPRGAGGWLSWDVTDWVQATRRDGGDLSLLLWGDDACQRIDFGSSESVNADERPMLRIDYRGPPAAPDAEADLERKAEAVALELIGRAKGETPEVAYELACSAMRTAPHFVKAHLMRAQAALDLSLNGLAGIQTAARDLTRARQIGLDSTDCPLARLASYRAWKSYADRRTSPKAQAAILCVFLLASAELEATPTDQVDEALVRRALGVLSQLSAVDQAESVVAAAKLWGDEAMASHRAAVRGRLLANPSSLSISRAATVYIARWPDPEIEALVLR